MLHDMIQKTVEKYQLSTDDDLRYKTNLKKLLLHAEQNYPITFISILNPDLESLQVAEKIEELVRNGNIESIHVENDPMLGRLLQMRSIPKK